MLLGSLLPLEQQLVAPLKQIRLPTRPLRRRPPVFTFTFVFGGRRRLGTTVQALAPTSLRRPRRHSKFAQKRIDPAARARAAPRARLRRRSSFAARRREHEHHFVGFLQRLEPR
jgi:hypothetical protein